MTEERLRLGWIGLGRMGLPMAKNLLPIAAPLKLFNRHGARAASLTAQGAVAAASAFEAARDCDVVFTMVADDDALEMVALGGHGALAAMPPGSILVDMSTVSPAISLRVAEAARNRGIFYLCAPVSGSVAMAETAKLTILVSGPPDQIARCAPCFARLAAKQFTVGSGDEARVLKLSLNLMIGTSAAMLAEALTLAEKAGIEWHVLLDVVANSALASPLVQYKTAQLKARDFSPMFMAHQMAKDFSLIKQAAADLGVVTPVAQQVSNYWREMMLRGLGEDDFIACLKIAEQDSGLE